MSGLAPMVINSLLGNHMSGAVNPDLASAVTEKASAESNKINRKHYSDGGYHHEHHDEYEHHQPTYVHHYSGGGYGKKKSRSVALTALTLLAFLFFLHILQSCLDQQMLETTTTTTAAPQIVVLQAKLRAREAAEKLAKEAQKGKADTVGEAQKEAAQRQSGETQRNVGDAKRGGQASHKRVGEEQSKGVDSQKQSGEMKRKVQGAYWHAVDTQQKGEEAQRRVGEAPVVVTENINEYKMYSTTVTTKRQITPISMFAEEPNLYHYKKVPVKMKLIESYRRP
ncbi:hypothetical protein JTB14_037734 [Gonioctena quinquepunctata]|nr:hypothetical protein JTB14_037734 [Gonioctena quinquepunctata]